MEWIIKILIFLIAALHLYFLWLEMFAWTTRAKKVFRGYTDDFFEKSKTLAANQGLYNGILAAGLLWTFLIRDVEWRENISMFFLSAVIVAGIFGAATADKKIFYVQASPAMIALGLLLLN